MARKGARVRGLCGMMLAVASAIPAVVAAQGVPVDLLTAANDALQFNAAYRAARAEYVAARELVPQATGKLLPQIGIQGKYDWIDESVQGDYYGVVDVDRSDGFDRWMYSAALKQAIYQPELFIGRSKAELELQQAGYALQQTQDELLLSVSESYFTALAAADTVKFSEAELRAVRQQLDQIRVRADSGLATDADVKAALAQYELSNADLADARIIYANSVDRLAALTGRQYDELRRLPERVVLAPPDPEDEDVWTQRATDFSVNVLLQKVGNALADLDYKRSKRLRYPTVDLVGNAFSLNNRGGATGERDENQTQIGVTVSLPLYTGGQISSAQRQALAMQEHAEAMYDSAVTGAVRDTRIAYRNSVSGQKRVYALERAVEAAVAAEDAMLAGFDAGTRTSADVLGAVERRYAAEGEYTSARYKVIVNTLKLKQAAGSLLVADLARLNRLLSY